MEKSIELEEVLGLLAHQLKSPVTTIQIAARFGRQAEDSAARDLCWDTVEEETTRLSEMIDGLLKLYQAQRTGRLDRALITELGSSQQETKSDHSAGRESCPGEAAP
jgi:signal transduction histidine kinase